MKVLVIGATGRAGSLAAQKLLDEGHQVTTFARNPAAVSVKGAGLKIVQGDLLDAASVDRAVAGQDAVLCAIGPRSLKEKVHLFETSTRNLVAAMRKHGVKRVVNLSALALLPVPGFSIFVFRHLIIPLLLKDHFADKERGEALLESSGLDYVNVHPGRLVSAPARGGVRAAADIAGYRGIKSLMTYEDLAAFMVAQLTANEWVGKSPLIGY